MTLPCTRRPRPARRPPLRGPRPTSRPSGRGRSATRNSRRRRVQRQDYDDAAAALEQARPTSKRIKQPSRRLASMWRIPASQAPLAHRQVEPDRRRPCGSDEASPFATIQRLGPIFVDVTQSGAKLLKLREGRHVDGRGRDSGSGRVRVKLILETARRNLTWRKPFSKFFPKNRIRSQHR